MATNMNEHLIKMIENKGWMAIESLYFDNAMEVDINATRGFIAISKSIDCVITLDTIDSVDMMKLQTTLVRFAKGNLSHGTSIVLADLAGLQRYNIATYAKSTMFNGRKEIVFPQVIPDAKIKGTYDTDIDDLYKNSGFGGTLTLNNGDAMRTLEVFDPTKVDECDQSWFDVDYLKDIWFKNKLDFNEKIAEYLDLPLSDII